MNTQIQEAANEWWGKLASKRLDELMEGYGFPSRTSPITHDEIVFIWIEEVVMKWWENGGCSRLEIAKKYCHLYDFSKPLSNSDVAEIYLKEHESKEDEGDIQGLITHDKMEIESGLFTDFGGSKEVSNVSEILLRKKAGIDCTELESAEIKRYFKEKDVDEFYKELAFFFILEHSECTPSKEGSLDYFIPKEEPVSISVEEAAIDFFEIPKEDMDAEDWSRINSFKRGAEWQKEQDKTKVENLEANCFMYKKVLDEYFNKYVEANNLIGELLEVLRKMETLTLHMEDSDSYNIRQEARPAITKATNYLNQQ